jgi:pyruvate,water dikinase
MKIIFWSLIAYLYGALPYAYIATYLIKGKKKAQYILKLREARHPRKIGNKGRSLRFLIEKNFRTPTTYVCTWDAYLRYLKNDVSILTIVRDELSKLLDENKHYAVRSSANIEDSNEHSFAGQFKTFLNVQGIDGIVEAIEAIWSSALSPNVRMYLERAGLHPRKLKMAVIIQEMVPPVFSGVAFSKNPITGMDEIVVEAVEGSGDSLAQKGVTPGRWINKWGEWITALPDKDIPLDIIQEVVAQTRVIAKLHGGNVDLEWVYDGQEVNWVQLRPITSLKNIPVYANHIAREVFPGMIKPLVWSINVPVVNGAWKRFLTELIGRNNIDASSLARSFYYRAYFNMGTIGDIFETVGLPRETIELLMGINHEGLEKPSLKPTRKSFLYLPGIIRFVFLRMGFGRRYDRFLSEAEGRLQVFPLDRLEQLSEDDLIAKVENLNAVMGELAYCSIAVQLIMGLYTILLNRQLKSIGFDFESFDLTRGMDELGQFSPAPSLARFNRLYRSLDEGLQEKIRKGSYQEFQHMEGIRELQEKMELFLKQFGHLSDGGNDFSKVPWRESPEVIFQMMVNYKQAGHPSRHAFHWGDVKVSRFRQWLINTIYRRVIRFRLYREKISFLSQWGYDRYRTCFLALGMYFVRRGFLQCPEDIFYLSLDEVKDISEQKQPVRTYADTIAVKKREMEEYQDITLPSVIYGDKPPPLTVQTVMKLKGIPTSRGQYKGHVKVIRGIKDFQRVEEGDVLVIPYSDVGWTPLFIQAGAVIAESGGILSHSSIIAREYNIPAVVSVPNACHLKDNTLVTVDGYHGEVVIHEPLEE